MNTEQTIEISKIEPLIKRWNDEADKLDEQIKRLESVRDMLAKEILQPEINCRILESIAFKHCATSLGIQINAQRYDIRMAEYNTAMMVAELELKNRKSKI